MARKEAIQVSAQSLGILSLNPQVAEEVAKEVEERMKMLVRDALKFMKHSHRETLSTDDLAQAFKIRSVEPVYGYSSSEPINFRRVRNTTDLYCLDDPVVKLEDVMREQYVARAAPEPYFTVHWLAVEGAQPLTPHNPGPEIPSSATMDGDESRRRKPFIKDKKDQKVKHVLASAQQLYFQRITDAVLGTDEILKSASYRSVLNDVGLHQLLPYFSQFVADEISNNLTNLPVLRSVLYLAFCLIANTNLHIEPYLHQLMPAILTCVVAKRLCADPAEDHWSLRDMAASVVAHICDRFGRAYSTLVPRVIKTLVCALLDPDKPLTTHYGSLVGLTKLGPQVVMQHLLRHAPTYSKLIEAEWQAVTRASSSSSSAKTGETKQQQSQPPTSSSSSSSSSSSISALPPPSSFSSSSTSSSSSAAAAAVAEMARLQQRRLELQRVRGALLNAVGGYTRLVTQQFQQEVSPPSRKRPYPPGEDAESAASSSTAAAIPSATVAPLLASSAGEPAFPINYDVVRDMFGDGIIAYNQVPATSAHAPGLATLFF